MVLSNRPWKRTAYGSKTWEAVVQRSMKFSVRFANLLDIPVDRLPCLVLFQDLNSSKHIPIWLNGLTAEEMAEVMRSVFAVIHKAIVKGKNPLIAVKRSQNNKKLKRVVGQVVDSIGKTLSTLIPQLLPVVLPQATRQT
jgi:hypothetical protein